MTRGGKGGYQKRKNSSGSAIRANCEGLLSHLARTVKNGGFTSWRCVSTAEPAKC